jgi:membrane carboxypeptidase/penicillin-binding protein
MSSTLTITRQRQIRRKKSSSSAQQRVQRAVLVFGFVVSAALVVSILASVLIYAGLTRSLPPVEEMPVLLNPADGLLLQPTRLYDRSGQHLVAVLAPTDAARRYISYEQLPQSLIDATVAAAEPHFWTSPGYRLTGWKDPTLHPTLAQSLAFDLLLWDVPPSTSRAIHERMLAAQMTAQYGRQRVMEWYLNSLDYGHYAFGAEAAAQLYLGKSVTEINLGEAALLVAIGQAPALNPMDVPEGMEERRIHVLQLMMEQGLITPAETAQGVLERPALRDFSAIGEKSDSEGDLAPAFVDFALSQLDAKFGAGWPERGGLNVLTSLDYDLQLQSVCAVRTELERLGGKSGTDLELKGISCEAARLLPTAQSGQVLPDASASVILLDPRNGQILAAVGDMQSGGATASLAPHPAGTAITPFIYLTGFSRGLNLASLSWDIPNDTPTLGQLYHGPVRLRTALANDYLTPAAGIIDQMSQDSIENIAASFGIKIPSGVRLLRDEFDLSPLEMAEAYGIFANEGELAGQAITGNDLEPVAVLQVYGVDHSNWADWSTPQTRSVVSQQLAYLMNQALSDETARWPALGHPNSLEIGRPVAAKISPTLDLASAWTVGYTPGRVAVVWLGTGREPAKNMGDSNLASSRSAELWHALVQYAVRDQPVESWNMPAGIVTVSVCDPSGLLPTVACPNVVSEIFLEGRQPVQPDDLYQTVQVNIETGLLATVFTQPELVENRTYMMIPAAARDWAISAGIPTPPIAYDTVQKPPVLPAAHISSPEMFADGRGIIKILGSAAGTDFLSYRLEYGQGLYPLLWVQIGTDSTTPISEGLLGEWDTTGLNGLYALRLMVVRSDQRVDQAVVQVTLDNTPPQIAITYPLDGQEIDRAQETHVALQAQASDPFLSKVDFYVDDTLVGHSVEAPFGVLWNAVKGKHTLRVVATDRAGNSAEARLQFSVK